ncbi:MAG: PAS domain-containing protein [Gemmatimonadota bacterium]|nr:PAS domain-containing protein [Gemmatimonadota bacterium]
MTRILIVDDKQENLYYLDALFTAHGYIVERAQHGAEALVRARAAVPDIIVSDLLMPVMDGYTLLRHWKSDHRLQRVPFVVYTATYTEPEDERLAYALGADAFILKPTEPDDLIARIRDVENAVRAGTPPRATVALSDEPDLLKVYSQTLVRKLEEKSLQLEEANQTLQREAADRRQMAELQSALLAAMGEGLQGLALDGTITFENDAAVRMLGWERGELIGKQKHALIHHHHPDGSPYAIDDCPIWKTMRDGKVRRVADDVFFRRDGSSFPVEYTCAPMRDADGQIAGVVLSFRDVSETRQAQSTVREQATLIENAQRIARMGSWHMDCVTGTLTWSDATCELFGISPNEFRGTFEHFRSFILPEDQSAEDATQARVSPEQPLLESEYRIRRPDGEIRWMYERGEVEFDASGKQIRRIGMVMDVTDQHEANARLAEANSLLRIAGRAAQLGGWRVDLPERRLVWSDAIRELHDVPPGRQLTHDENLALYPPESRLTIDRLLADCERDGIPFDVELEKRTITGRQIWVRTVGEAVRNDEGRIVQIQGALQDVTARRSAQEASRQRDAVLRIANRMTRTGGWAIEFPDMRTVWSDEIFDMLDFPRGAVPPLEEALTLYPEPGRTELGRLIERCAGQGASFEMELPIVTKTGRRLWARVAGEAHRGDSGQIVRVQGAFQDITERRRAEDYLRESEERFRQLAETITQVFWISDVSKRRILYVSPAYEAIWGRPAAELYEHPETWLTAVHEDDRPTVQRALALQATGGYDVTYRIVRPDGAIRWVNDRAYPVLDDQGRAYRIVGVAEDHTERKAIEAQFLRAQRMESIGTLAGGIAHDLNNVLTPILMSIEMLRDENHAEGRAETLATIEASAMKGADMVRQVLSFARGVEGQRMDVDPRRLLRDVAKIGNDTFLKSIQVRVSVASDVPAVLGDPTQLHQVLLNLCVNARDAMPEGGTITLTARARELTAVQATAFPDAKPGAYVMLEVTDTGLGMPRDVLDRIFEPFFTTKEPGKGTGLGLSTSLAIVKSHGGFFNVRSTPGAGTTFEVFLPVSSSENREEASAARRAKLRGHNELVLVVDDEATIREMTRRMLEMFGYRVIVAADGAAAVDAFRANLGSVSVVLTDMMMPVMNGAATVRALRALEPGVRVVAVSGLGDAVDLPGVEAPLHRPVRRLAKPYTTEELLEALFQALHDDG